MSTRLQAVIALVMIGLTSAAITSNAEACGIGDGSSWSSRHWSMPQATMPSVASQFGAITPQDAANKINPLQSVQHITGMYQFTMVAQGNKTIPDGVTLDQGFTVWHADGTEIMNSGKPPSSGSFCLGVWVQTGVRSYKLNHWALNWNDAGTIFLGPVNIQEKIKLDADGDSYSGSFTLTQYSPDGHTPLGGVKGIVSATRVRADSN